MWPARPRRSGAPGRSPRPGSRPRFPWSPRRACAKAIRLLLRPPPRRRPSRLPRPATQPRRPRQAPSRPGARTAKRRAVGDPQSRPGTRSCSGVPASETYGEMSRDRPLSPGHLGTGRLASRFSPAPRGLPSRTLPRTEQAARRWPRRPEGLAGGRWRESHGCLGSIHDLGDVAAGGGAGRWRPSCRPAGRGRWQPDTQRVRHPSSPNTRSRPRTLHPFRRTIRPVISPYASSRF
jgi:hypothetical protein